MFTSMNMLDSSVSSDLMPIGRLDTRLRASDQIMADLDEQIQAFRNAIMLASIDRLDINFRYDVMEELDEKIHAFQNEIISLNKKRNKYASFNVLPVEILQKIFKMVEIDNCCHWISITEVCQKWRDISLDYAPLWTFIDSKHKYSSEHIDMILERSKDAQLTVFYNFDSNSYEDIFEPTMAQLSRIRSLSLTALVEEWPFLEFHLSYPAPCLKEFRLNLGRTKIRNVSPNILFPAHSLFRDQVPMLELFSCQAPPLPWRISVLKLTGLTELIMRQDLRAGSMWNEVCLVLKENPRLQILRITGMTADTGVVNVSKPVSPIALPCLKILFIENITRDIVSSFLKMLQLPKDISWFIKCESDPQAFLGFPTIMDGAASCSSLLLTIESTMLRIASKGGELNNLTRSLLYNWTRDVSSLTESISIALKVISYMSWQSTTDLTMMFKAGPGQDDYIFARAHNHDSNQILPRFSELRSLKVTISDKNISYILHIFLHELLQPTMTVDSRNGPLETILCPNLSKLAISPIDGDVNSRDVQCLLRLLKFRDEHGVRVRYLDIRDHYGASQETENLFMASGYVDKVLWK